MHAVGSVSACCGLYIEQPVQCCPSSLQRVEAFLPTGRLSQIDNIKSQRLDTLSRILRCGDGMRKAYEWVMQAKQAGRFRGPVFGPILLEVECQDQQHTRYLENQVPST